MTGTNADHPGGAVPACADFRSTGEIAMIVKAEHDGTTDVTAVILAAGATPPTIPVASYVPCTSMMPVAGRPLLHWQLLRLLELGVGRVTILTRETVPSLEELARAAFGDALPLTFLAVGRTASVLDTLRAGLDRTTAAPVLVLLGDTLFTPEGDLFAAPATVLVSAVEDPSPWCTALVDGDRVTGLVEKAELAGSGGTPGRLALVGVYAFRDSALLAARLDRALGPAAAADPAAGQLSLLLRPYVEEGALHWQSSAEWLDYGHPTEAAVATARLRARAFNTISVDQRRGVLTKESVHVEKLWDELHYVESLPAELRHYFPRVLASSFADGRASVTSEYYGYPTLAELFLYADLGAAKWGRLLGVLGTVLDDFGAYRRELPVAGTVDMYLEKIYRRLEASTVAPEVRRAAAMPELEVNGVRVVNPLADRDALARTVADAARLRPATVIHGDFTFSNILVEPVSEVCRLIDPRGSFGLPGIFGDPWYDLAKLAHAAVGHYDVLAQDLFEVEGSRGSYGLTLHTTAGQRAVGEQVLDWLAGRAADPAHVCFLAGLIFLSLPSYHFESPERQLGLFLRGCQLANGAVEKGGLHGLASANVRGSGWRRLRAA